MVPIALKVWGAAIGTGALGLGAQEQEYVRIP